MRTAFCYFQQKGTRLKGRPVHDFRHLNTSFLCLSVIIILSNITPLNILVILILFIPSGKFIVVYSESKKRIEKKGEKKMMTEAMKKTALMTLLNFVLCLFGVVVVSHVF